MSDINITAIDDVWLRIDAPDAILREISDYFCFETPNAKFLQRRAQYRKWDGKIRLFRLKTRLLYRGLVPRILEFAEQRGYAVDNQVPDPQPLYPVQELDAFINNEHLPFPVRDYQYDALRQCLDAHRGIILSPTGSGKSFIIYLLQKMLGGRCLIVVPSIGLVSQMTNDFRDYGCDVANEVHQIRAGKLKEDESKNIYVSTWQSIYQMPADYFEQFDVVIVDEVHEAKAKSLTHLMEQCRNVPYRFGFTGTLDDTQAHRLILEGLFGSVMRVTTTSALIKKKELSPLRINMIVLKYPVQACRLMKRSQYQDEIDYVVQDRVRLEFVVQLAASRKGNTLVLFNFIEKHGIPLLERMRAACPDKHVHYIAGSVDGDTREDIRKIVATGDNHIIVASYGTFARGVNIPSLRHLIAASPSKSKIRVIQAIGRTLRLHEDKSHATLYDVTDDLRHGAYVNYLMRHAEERMRYYAEEKFPVSLHEIPLDAFARKLSPNVTGDTTSDEDALV